MRVVMISCPAYRDTHAPFFALLEKFWPDREYPFEMVSEEGDRRNWCASLVHYARQYDEPLMIMQDDFFLTSPVENLLIEKALEHMKERNAGMLRLYPCPGSNLDYGDENFGIVQKGSEYRISCQASLWMPRYLATIASQCTTPWDFEIRGTQVSDALPDEVLATRRESEPWPINYYCSAIGRGLWNPGALEHCKKHGIPVDTSLRGIAAA